MKITSAEEAVAAYLDAYQQGNAPSMDSYIKQYPQFAQQLAQMLPLACNLQNLSPAPAVPANAQLDDYQLLHKIGAGGMGTVYEANQISLNRKVAVKLLSRALIGDDSQRRQFENEARIIARLHHPNIVKVLSVKCTAQQCYYAMELVDGQGLNQCRVDSIRQLAQMGLQAARAMAYAHSCQVMHRDIKPANILLDSQGQVHISDFGIACVLQDPSALSGPLDPKSGTVRYMAPERLEKGENTYSCDIYALGVTLYELAAQQPFVKGKTYQEMARQIRQGQTPRCVSGEADFDAIVNKCIRFHPQERYHSMEELAQDLQRFLNYKPVHAAQTGPLKRYRLWCKRSPAAAFFSGLTAVCAVGLVLSLVVGFIRTQAALTLARRNAAVADESISNVFNYIYTQVPSAAGSTLLEQLMPYYQEISSQRQTDPQKVAAANRAIGQSAMRAGNYALAEKAFRQVAAQTKAPQDRNDWAQALEKTGQPDKAQALRQEISQQYANAPDPAQRYQAVLALQALHTPEAQKMAFDLLKNLLQEDPTNAGYLYSYALLLGGNPRYFLTRRISGITPNAVLLLKDLADKNPHNPEYGLALVQLMTRKLTLQRPMNGPDENDINLTLELAERMLGHFPNTPQVATSCVALWQAYRRHLLRQGEQAKARKETEHLLGMLELLFYGPQTPDEVKEALLQLQQERLALFQRDGRTESAQELQHKIALELKYYTPKSSVHPQTGALNNSKAGRLAPKPAPLAKHPIHAGPLRTA